MNNNPDNHGPFTEVHEGARYEFLDIENVAIIVDSVTDDRMMMTAYHIDGQTFSLPGHYRACDDSLGEVLGMAEGQSVMLAVYQFAAHINRRLQSSLN
jgi:hypothetical protein